jgi:EthD domain
VRLHPLRPLRPVTDDIDRRGDRPAPGKEDGQMPQEPAVKIIALISRKPGLSREEFIEHYENHHAKLIARYKHKWMLDYRRNYPVPASSFRKLDGADGQMPDCDVITEASFATVEDYEAFTKASLDPEFGSQVVADEETFMDRGSIRFFRVDVYPSDLSEAGTAAPR